MEYKFVEKYLNKNKKEKKSYFSKFITRVCICILLLVISLVLIKYDSNNKKIISSFLNDKGLNMATINKWYKSKFGDITPFQDLVKDKTKLVFNNNLEYTSLEDHKDYIKLTVSDQYTVPVLESGIVVFSGDKDIFGKTIIIEQTNGVSVWYGNIENKNLNLYDYVSKGEIVGSANKDLYLAFQKDGKYISYKDYLK